MRSILLAGAAILGLAGAANAVPIPAGSILNIVGNANFSPTSITFTNPANLVAGTGAFTTLGTCTGCVVMVTPRVYSPTPIEGPAYTATNLGLSSSFTTTALVSQSGNGVSTLGLQYSGTATLSGFDTTPGTWVVTVNQLGGLIGSFSTSTIATPTPEPMALALLGTGLLGLAAVRYRRR